ncbi:hypothetical protein QBC34DRAFT_412667 [Podospora aff. communis PSN243]|uniref:DUF8212 domain-containing protein n=1 Tax=Podospora aff. communis PSN243 TaxID=3040156 RepID=A0AAV9GCH5_9PEZI|nr:hypothetical protein QBC34DRAFT_412667 [Podospora aff. communis PSN243]
MYQWYRQAAVCYVFLADVPTLDGFQAKGSAFRKSRWFTRGWTLQELIAPERVEFFAKDQDGAFISKSHPPAFVQVLSEITGISVDVLSGKVAPTQLSVATRMKWAAHRKTTRPEDEAYCLVGLFDINLPLFYGEGRSRAFLRLQEEILKTTNDQSLFAWTSIPNDNADPDKLHGLFAQSPANFRHSSNMQPLPRANTHASMPAATTSQGLRIQLYLEPVSKVLPDEADPLEEDYYAILDCDVLCSGHHQRPGIRLRRVSEDQYARVHVNSLIINFEIPTPPSSPEEQSGYRTIYVHQAPVHHSLPHIQVSALNQPSNWDNNPLGLPVLFKRGSGYTLSDVVPRSRWNSHTMTMALEYTRKPSFVAAFRFERTRVGQGELRRRVDVIVGIQRLDVLRWEGWCFQLVSDISKDLATVFSDVQKRMQRISKVPGREDITPAALCSLLGHDVPHSEVFIKDMEQQGRPYLSIQLLKRHSPVNGPPADQLDILDGQLKRPEEEPGIHSPALLVPLAPPFASGDDQSKARRSVTLSLRPYSTYSNASSSSRNSSQLEGLPPIPPPDVEQQPRRDISPPNTPELPCPPTRPERSPSQEGEIFEIFDFINPYGEALVASFQRVRAADGHNLPTPSPSPDQTDKRRARVRVQPEQDEYTSSQDDQGARFRASGRSDGSRFEDLRRSVLSPVHEEFHVSNHSSEGATPPTTADQGSRRPGDFEAGHRRGASRRVHPARARAPSQDLNVNADEGNQRVKPVYY